MTPRGAPCEGTVLVFALAVMTATIAFGLVYLETSAFSGEVIDASLARVRTRGLVDAGIEVAIRQLIDEPSYRGAISTGTLTTGTYSATISGAGPEVEIKAIGTATGLSLSQVSRARIDVRFEPGDVLRAAGNVAANGASLTWTGDLRHTGDFYPATGASGNAIEDESIEPVVIDFSALQSVANQEVAGGSILPPGTYSPGILYTSGNLHLNGPLEVLGTLVVTGDLLIHGNGGTIRLTQGSAAAVFLVGGNVTIDGTGDLTVSGTAVVNGSVTVNTIDTLTWSGTLFCDGNVAFNNPTSLWDLDPDPSGTPPLGVTGLPAASMQATVEELWRRPD